MECMKINQKDGTPEKEELKMQIQKTRINVYTITLQKHSWGYGKPQTEGVENMSTEQK